MNNFKYNSIKITPFKWFVLENFPFIEEDFDSLTSYGLWCKLKEYFDKVATKTDEMGTQVESLTNAFIQLKNYIDNYFENLDVQEEINNKLDEMVEDGTLENILLNYVNVTKVYNTTVDMLNDSNLKNGMKIKTLGYYDINDGGNSEFYISNTTNNNSIQLQCNNNLYANLIIKNNTINIKSLGARCQQQNNKYDIHDYIMMYINYIKNVKNKSRLYIPSGFYHTTQVDFDGDFDIYGDYNFTTSINKGTTISPLNNNQNYIFNIGSENKYTTSSKMCNIRFTTLQQEYDSLTDTYNSSTLYKINNSCLNLLYVTTSIFDNIFFTAIKGCAFSMSSCWELYFKLLNFRYIDNLGDAIVKFLPNNYSLTNAPNISACTFENVMFERTHGSLFSVEANASFGNNKFGTINFENAKWEANYLSGYYTDYDDTNLNTNINGGEYMFNLKSGCNFNADIDDIVCNNIRNFFFTRDDKNYSFLNIFRTSNVTQLNAIVNNINIIGMKNNINILVTGSSNDIINPKSSFIVNNIILSNSDFNILFTVRNMPYIRVNNIQRGSNITDSKYAYTINNSITPFYKNLIINKETRGKIFTNDASICECNFSTKISNDENFPDTYYIINSSDNLMIRAQIPDGTTTTIKLKVGSYEGTVDLVGTGAFKTYRIEGIHNIINYPTAEGLAFSKMIISKVSGEENSWFDCFMNY